MYYYFIFGWFYLDEIFLFHVHAEVRLFITYIL